jgi:hypothetical protein
MSSIAVFLVLGGAAFAATQLPKNSVGTKQLKRNAVTTAKIKKNAVTGAKVNESTLGEVPLAAVANSVPPSQLHVVGAPGEPAFLNGAHNLGAVETLSLPGASFIKTRDNIVQLEGVIEIPASAPLPVAYQLPPGFRPPSGQLAIMEQNETTVIVAGSNVVIEGQDISGDVLTNSGEPAILTGFSFFAGS